MEFLEVITIPVTNQEKAKEFYLNIGFQLIIEADMGNGHKWVQVGFPGQATSLTLVDYFDNMTPGSSYGLVINTKDIEKDVEDLRAKGVVIDRIDPTPWGRFANFVDPDGNGMTLRQE
jgi:predicted enzyme related to lactoylglutathione lyase